jgi:hypothetical protein
MKASNLIRRAMRLTGMLDANGTPSAEDMADAIDTLEALFAEWRGADIMVPDYAIDGPDDELTIDAADREAVAYQLAVRLAPEYQSSMSAEAQSSMTESWSRFMHRYFQPGRSDLRELPMDVGRWSWARVR